MISLLLFVNIWNSSVGYKSKCPETSQWSIRAKALCPDPKKYFCLENELTNAYSENCTKFDYDRGGRKIILRGGLDVVDCSLNRYQPREIFFYTNARTDCLYQKSLCSEEGQVIYDEGNPNNDVRCRCDYTRGYVFSMIPKNCSCIPSEEDCSCYLKTCHDSSLVPSKDYDCMRKELASYSTRCGHLATKRPEPANDVITQIWSADDNHVYKDQLNVRSAIVAVLVISVVISVFYMVPFFCGLKIESTFDRHIRKVSIINDADIIIVEEGQSATISYELCEENKGLFWHKNNDWIYVSGNSKYKIEENVNKYKLIIKYVSQDDGGDYMLRSGSKNSPVTKLVVKPLFNSSIEPGTCVEGDNVCFSCEVTYENLEAVWYKDDNEITDREMVQVIGFQRLLKINKADIKDSGTYRIQVNLAMQKANLKVIPFFQQKLKETVIMEGLPISFSCFAKNGLKPEWTINDKKLSSSEDITIEEFENGEYRISLYEAKLSDKGLYKIILDGHESEAELDVKAMPDEIKRMSDEDRRNFFSAAREGTAPRYFFRVMIVGENGVGKTSLLRRLMNNDIEDVESTDGINIVLKRCQIERQSGKWMFSGDIDQACTSEKDETDELADCGFWDFAGQKDYYATHQTFLTPNAIYLLVVSLKEIFEPSLPNAEICNATFDEIIDYVSFWLDNIHCYVKTNPQESMDKSSSATRSFPPVVIVGTHVDSIKDKQKEEIQEEFDKYLDKCLLEAEKRTHLRQNCFLSNTIPKLNEFEELRQCIFNIAKAMPKWGECLPKRWIFMEKELQRMRTQNIKVVSYDETVEMARARMIDTNMLDSFLRFEHEVGNIIFFDSIKDNIILDPKWLVDAFRCLVAADQFYHPAVPKIDMRKTGRLSNCIIELLFEKVPELGFLQHKDFLLKILEQFDIIVKSLLRFGPGDYYMPCMITTTTYDDIVNRYCSPREKCMKTSWLILEFKFLPPALFNHILVSYIKKYFLCSDKNNKAALGHGIGLFKLAEDGCEMLLVVAAKNSVAIQIWNWDYEAQSEESYCMIRKDIIAKVNKLARRYQVKISYDIKLKCSEGKHDSPIGRISGNSTKTKKRRHFKCDEHNGELHAVNDVFKFWFELQNAIVDCVTFVLSRASIIAVNVTSLCVRTVVPTISQYRVTRFKSLNRLN